MLCLFYFLFAVFLTTSMLEQINSDQIREPASFNTD